MTGRSVGGGTIASARRVTLVAFFAVVLCSVGCLVPSARSEDGSGDSYLLRITQTADQSPAQETLVCTDTAKQLCHGDIVLFVGGRKLPLTVTALFERGSAYLKFCLGGTYLFAGSQPYAHLVIDRFKLGEDSLVLYLPPRLAPEDAPTPLLHRPVERGSGIEVGTLKIEVMPGD
jgi:hypothetical protein